MVLRFNLNTSGICRCYVTSLVSGAFHPGSEYSSIAIEVLIHLKSRVEKFFVHL